MDSTFYDLPEVEAGGREPPKTNPPSPSPKFNFLATMVTNRPWLAVDFIVVPSAQHPLPKHP